VRQHARQGSEDVRPEAKGLAVSFCIDFSLFDYLSSAIAEADWFGSHKVSGEPETWPAQRLQTTGRHSNGSGSVWFQAARFRRG